MENEEPQIQNPEQPAIDLGVESKPPFWKRRYARIVFAVVVLAIVASLAWLLWPRSSNNSETDTMAPAEESHQVIVNEWSGTPIDPKKIPLGDGKVSSEPKKSHVFSCTSNFRNAVSEHGGPWIDEATNTWDSEEKVTVRGEKLWQNANYSEKVSGKTRTLTLNDLPVDYPTGTFPIAHDDPAYQYDRNPNGIEPQSLTYNLPLNPEAAASPSCTSLGAIGVLSNGVLLFNALDDAGNDAAAHETQDLCDGHPAGQQNYHYHGIPSCLLEDSKGASTLIGYALDGYGIYVERDVDGNLPTNADLDECHGRSSPVMWNGEIVNMYHYSATLEYPYTVGCYHGTPVVTDRAPARRGR